MNNTQQTSPTRAAAQHLSRHRRPALSFVGFFVAGCLLAVLTIEMLAGSLLQQRSQHDLLHQFQEQLVTASQRGAAVSAGIARQKACATGEIVSGCRTGAEAVRPDASDPLVTGPLRGRPVALLVIPRLHLSQVVVEGAQPAQTRRGPGHVPGTALPGQPGNAAIVGRRTSWGAVFRNLGHLHRGDQITVTTAQGLNTYVVTGRGHATHDDPFSDVGDNRLTLATADPPFVGSGQLIVNAKLSGEAHAATRRGVRDVREDGTRGNSHGWAELLIYLQALALVSAGTAILYRRWHLRSTYLLSTPVILALLLLLAQATDSLLPSTL